MKKEKPNLMVNNFEPTESHPLAGKHIFISGGTRGFMLDMAKDFARQGCSVTVGSRNPENCSNAQQSLKSISEQVSAIPFDARNYDEIAGALKKSHDLFGPIDVVIAAQAGNFVAPANQLSANGFKTIIDIDLIGSFNLFRASWDFIKKPGASLIAITTPSAKQPVTNQAHVCSAKAGVNMLIKCLALEWGASGVRVNGISPGPVMNSFGMDQVLAADEEIQKRVLSMLPLGRYAHSSEISKAGQFLASDDSSYITGTILDIDGGMQLNMHS